MKCLCTCLDRASKRGRQKLQEAPTEVGVGVGVGVAKLLAMNENAEKCKNSGGNRVGKVKTRR